MTNQETSVPDEIVERIQKILALGRRGGTEAEATAAMAKAQDLLAKYNLDLATVERGGKAGDARREQASAAGGMYHYQRGLWRAVAELNFCTYFLSGHFKRRRVHGVERDAWISQHAFVGRKVNTAATMAMGGYLEQEIERLCRERLDKRIILPGGAVHRYNVQSQFFSSWAVGFREGAADRVIMKLQDERRRKLRDDEKRAARAAAAAGSSTATALTLGTLAQQERAGNYDFIHGEGAWAQKMAEQAAAAEEERLAEEAWVKFKAEHPEEARKQEEAAAKERRRSWSGGGSRSRKVDRSGYMAGTEVGDNISLHQQADRANRKAIGARS